MAPLTTLIVGGGFAATEALLRCACEGWPLITSR